MKHLVSTPLRPRPMKVEICRDHELMSTRAAGCLAREFKRNPGLLLCLATGATPARTYELLGRRAGKSAALFHQLRVLKLDEWGALAMTDPASCELFLRERVIRPWGISPRHYAGFRSQHGRSKTECERIHQWLARNGPIDLCVLGLGRNGHLGLNEPRPALCPVAHLARLAAETRAHSMLAGAAVKPDFGLTLGMAEILQARQILLLVSGEHKRPALRRLLRREITPEFPASFLWLHPRTTVLCDRAAAGQMKEDA